VKVVILGTTSVTLAIANAVVDSGCDLRLMVNLEKDLLPDNSVSIENYCSELRVGYVTCRQINHEDTLKSIEQTKPDLILSTWPHFIPAEVLKIPRLGVVGTHPAPLPYGRGRHPIHWSIAMGIKTSEMCFFWMDEDYDTGAVLTRSPFEIGMSHIEKVMKRLEIAAYDGARQLCQLVSDREVCSGIKQMSGGTVWPKRTLDDVTLDPRLTAEMTIGIVRSFSNPYGCALLYLDKNISLRIIDASLVDAQNLPTNWVHQAHGHVFEMTESTITIRVADAVVLLTVEGKIPNERSLSHIRPPTYYRC
jgi:methionyl-tRNA formyltransferase